MCAVIPEKDPGCVLINVYVCKLLSIGNGSARLTAYLKHLWWQNISLKSFLDYKLYSKLPCFASCCPSPFLTLTVQIWYGQETAFYGIWRFITILQCAVTGLWFLISVLRFYIGIDTGCFGSSKNEKFLTSIRQLYTTVIY